MSDGPIELLSQLLAADVTSMDGDGARHACEAVSRLRGVLDAAEARFVARLAELHAAGHAAAPAEILSGAGKVSNREARRQISRAQAMEQLPVLADALVSGAVSGSQVEVIGRTAARLDDAARAVFLADGAALIEAAGRLSADDFERHCRHAADRLGDGGAAGFERARRRTRLRHWIDRDSGMYQLHGALDPELGAAVFTALDDEVERLFHSAADTAVVRGLESDNEHLAAHALARLLHRGHHATGGGPVSAEVSVLIDERTLRDGLHEHGACELADGSPIPVDTARRLACDAGILPIVMNGHGVAVDVGRAQRLATSAQRKALRAMHATCAFDGCDVEFSRCQPHHLHPWEAGGSTDLCNLVPLCHRHHHLVHEGRWRLDLDPATRALTITRPDGVVHATTPPLHGRAAA